MKALSIKQPWASLIAHGLKDIENRTWRTHFRGKIYIHASAKDFGSLSQALNNEQWDKTIKHWDSDYFPNRPLSAIIGEVEIVDCVQDHPSIWAEKHNDFLGEFIHKPIWNWVLANPVLYDKPILNVKGKLSFWQPDIAQRLTQKSNIMALLLFTPRTTIDANIFQYHLDKSSLHAEWNVRTGDYEFEEEEDLIDQLEEMITEEIINPNEINGRFELQN